MKITGEQKETMGYKKRKWRVDIDQDLIRKIQSSRNDYEKYLKLHNNTANKEVWKVYDHLAADLTNEVLAEIMGTIDRDLDKFCEKVIIDEFYS
jgi:hypothetical protein